MLVELQELVYESHETHIKRSIYVNTDQIIYMMQTKFGYGEDRVDAYNLSMYQGGFIISVESGQALIELMAPSPLFNK